MNRGVAKLDDVRNVVLDEADEMLNMGFSESIDAILEGVPEDRNTLLFSATMSREIERIAKGYLRDYKEIVVGSRNEGAEHVNHIYYMVNAKDKYLALKRLVDYYPRIFAIIFCRTKIETQEVADKLIKDGYNAESLHGDLSQQQRDLTMQKFRQHTVQLLVATDVAARGLDVDDLTHVINYGLPDDIENYTHRSGRTGRAGKKGTSISIVHIREKHKIRNIEKEIGKKFEEGIIPSAEEICKKQLYKVMDQIVKTDVNDDEIAPFMQDINRYFEFMDKDEIIKKIVSREFGRFLSYYADAPEIEKPVVAKKGERKEKGEQNDRQKSGETADDVLCFRLRPPAPILSRRQASRFSGLAHLVHICEDQTVDMHVGGVSADVDEEAVARELAYELDPAFFVLNGFRHGQFSFRSSAPDFPVTRTGLSMASACLGQRSMQRRQCMQSGSRKSPSFAASGGKNPNGQAFAQSPHFTHESATRMPLRHGRIVL
jgi:superfamily II DNA/RNA helicase